jgi:hypothetical protein
MKKKKKGDCYVCTSLYHFASACSKHKGKK